MTWKWLSVVPLIVILAMAARLAATKAPITLAMVPRVGFAPQTVYLTITVEPNAAYRRLRVEAISEEAQRASELPLDGLMAPRTTRIVWRGLPAGRYIVTAGAWSSNRVEASARQELLVVDGSAP